MVRSMVQRAYLLFLLCGTAVMSAAIPVVTPQISPTAVYVGQAAQITVTSNLSADTTIVPASVALFEYDVYGKLIGSVGLLYDDGTHGDTKAGDGVYTTQLNLAAQASQTALVFKVSTMHKGSLARTLSDPAQFDFLTPLTAQQISDLNTNPQAGATFYNNLLVGGASLVNAQAQTVAWLQSQPGILTAQAADNGSSGIWLVFTSGILGGISLVSDDVRGGGLSRHASQVPKSLGQGTHPMLQTASSTTSQDNLVNTNAILFDPFPIDPDKKTGKRNDETPYPGDLAPTPPKLPVPSIYSALQSRSCATVAPPKYNHDADRASFETLNQYGIVAIVTHGDTWYNGFDPIGVLPGTLIPVRYPLLTHFHGGSPGTAFDVSESQVVFYTGENALISAATLDIVTLADLLNGDLALGFRFDLSDLEHSGLFYVLTPAFIRDHNSNFQNSIVYIDACRSLFVRNAPLDPTRVAPPDHPPDNNYTMANAFHDKGAGAYLGYTEYVPTPYGYTVGSSFFGNLVKNVPVGVALTSTSSNTGGLDNILETGSTGLAYLELDPRSDVTLTVPACPLPASPEFIFIDGEPGSLTISINGVSQRFNGLGQGQTEDLGIASLPGGKTYTLVVTANGGFADFTINLPPGFMFTNGQTSVTNHIISFAGPNTYQFTSPTLSSAMKVVASSETHGGRQ